jgi:sRNA-binding carbon storage regulator CsrA
MKAPRDVNHGRLSLQLNLGESVELEIEGKLVRITVYETHKNSARLNFKADMDVKINRLERKRRVLNS